MKKRTNLIIAAVGLGALMTVGGTLAWFTDSDEVTNTITVNSMDFELTEPSYHEGDKIAPGATIFKDPTVTNVDNVTGYVKMTVDPTFTAEGEDPFFGVAALNESVVKYIIGEKQYTLEELADYWNAPENDPRNEIEAEFTEDGKLVIYTILGPKEKFTMFEKVHFDGDQMGNEYMDKELEIVVAFDALQWNNNELAENQTIKQKFDAFTGTFDPVNPFATEVEENEVQ